mmetsp:Transcript_122919/g.229671  ORF Transcript_122919/g.229671 Transcript_122919/m.229671 type:complete len:130 (-) Transcript_122919:54-443(-)
MSPTVPNWLPGALLFDDSSSDVAAVPFELQPLRTDAGSSTGKSAGLGGPPSEAAAGCFSPAPMPLSRLSAPSPKGGSEASDTSDWYLDEEQPIQMQARQMITHLCLPYTRACFAKQCWQERLHIQTWCP